MVAMSGEGARTTMTAGLNLVFELFNADDGIKAERLLSKLATICKRVHGSDHGLTHNIVSELQAIKVRYVKINYQHESKSFEVLRYEEDEKKYVVQGTIADPRNIGKERTVTIAIDDVLPDLGTPVL